MNASRRWPPYYTVVLLCLLALVVSYIDRSTISVASIAMQQQFGWSDTTKGLVLASFFAGYMMLQVASGALANRYGGKPVLGAAVLWWSLCTVLTPAAAFASLPTLIGARIALGLGEAAVFPASINMIGRWVPESVRSRAVATFISGVSLGTVISLPATGWLVRSFGWPAPFYLFGAMGVLWAIAWFTAVGEGSAAPPRAVAPQRTIPWKDLASTPSVWAIVVGHFGHNWLVYVLLAWLPSYFSATFGVSIASAGVLSAAPWLSHFVVANLSGVIADWSIRRGVSRTLVRKVLQGTGLLGPAVLFLLLPYAGSVAAGALIMCGAAGAMGLCSAGYACNAFDITPEYAEVVWGISNTVATLPGIVGVALTGWLLQRTGSYAAPFLLVAAMAACAAGVYLIFASGERQIWVRPDAGRWTVEVGGEA